MTRRAASLLGMPASVLPDDVRIARRGVEQFPLTAERLLENAASYLGTPEAGLDPAWRIGRRGDESFALTEDFVVGRFTVELGDDGTGAFLVTSVTVELPGGPKIVSEETLLERVETVTTGS